MINKPLFAKLLFIKNMKFKIYIFQICVIVSILAFLFFCFCWINIHLQNPEESFKNAADLTIGFLGPITTLAAAVIAVILFTDWREVKQYEIILNYILVIKKQVQELITFINSNRQNFINFRLRLKSPNLNLDEYQSIHLQINKIESDIVNRLNLIGLEMNELYYLKQKGPEDPVTLELTKKIKHFDKIGVHSHNYHDVLINRKTTQVMDQYFDYITIELMEFVYNEIMTQYLDDLILDIK